MKTIQELFNANSSSIFTLSPDEYEGPLVVDRPCVIHGSGSTLWAAQGPVLRITAPNVTIKDLHIAITGKPQYGDRCAAIKAGGCNVHNTTLENVEVTGRVVGLTGESENWRLPDMISFGEFAADKKNTFSVNIYAPCRAEISSGIKGLSISEGSLRPGNNTLTLTMDSIKHDTIIYGELLVKTSVLRRIYVWGKAVNGAPLGSNAAPEIEFPSYSSEAQTIYPKEAAARETWGEAVRYLRRGERIFASELNSPDIKIVYEYASAPKGVEVDGYYLLLNRNEMVSGDKDFIYFKTTESPDNSVRSFYIDENPAVAISLERVSERINKIIVCYSIYGNGMGHNFSAVREPFIRIFGGGREILRFKLEGLMRENAVVAVEIYRYNGAWKINPVGAGLCTDSYGKSGLLQLCERYGVEVE